MSIDIARTWKDADYRKSLTAEELALVPENPVGEVELADDDLLDVVGGGGTQTCCQAVSVCLNSVICSVIC